MARQVQLVAEALAERGHVTVVSPVIREGSIERSEHNGLPMYRVYMREPPRRLTEVMRAAAFVLFFFHTVWLLRRIVKRERVEIVHLNYIASNQIYFAALRALGGPPYVVTVRGDDVIRHHERSWTERMAVRYIYQHAGRMLANARGFAELTRQTFELPDVGWVWNCVRFGDMPDEAGAANFIGDVP